MVTVGMNLTDQDAENASEIERISGARSKAHAVGIALSATRFLIEAVGTGAKLYLEYPSGERAIALIPGVTEAL